LRSELGYRVIRNPRGGRMPLPHSSRKIATMRGRSRKKSRCVNISARCQSHGGTMSARVARPPGVPCPPERSAVGMVPEVFLPGAEPLVDLAGGAGALARAVGEEPEGVVAGQVAMV